MWEKHRVLFLWKTSESCSTISICSLHATATEDEGQGSCAQVLLYIPNVMTLVANLKWLPRPSSKAIWLMTKTVMSWPADDSLNPPVQGDLGTWVGNLSGLSSTRGTDIFRMHCQTYPLGVDHKFRHIHYCTFWR